MSTMCSLSKKYLSSNKEKYIKFLDNPKFMCTNCGRLANRSSDLCKPILLDLPSEKDNKLKKRLKQLKKKIKKLRKKLKSS